MYPTEYLAYGSGESANIITKPNGAKQFKLTDHLGSTRVAYAVGGLMKSYDHGPSGEQLTPGPEPRKGFIDKELDRENRSANLGVRQYDPIVSRFLSIDPKWATMPAWSPYHYSYSNPVNLSDKWGECPSCAASEAPETNIDGGGPQLDEDNKYVNGFKGALIREGYAAAKSGALRKEYISKVSPISSSDNTARNAAITEIRQKTPAGYRAITEKMKPSGTKPRVGATANKTNATVNKVMKGTGAVGKVMLGVGVGISAYNIATAENTGKAIVEEGGGWAGALAGGFMGAEVGMKFGMLFGPTGAIIGAFVGGIAGGIYGGYKGQQAGEAVYEALDNE